MLQALGKPLTAAESRIISGPFAVSARLRSPARETSSRIRLRAPRGRMVQLLYRSAAGAIAGGVNRDGLPFNRVNAAPADEDLIANEAMWWFDSTNGAAKVKFKAKQADGKVRNGELRLRDASPRRARSAVSGLSSRTRAWVVVLDEPIHTTPTWTPIPLLASPRTSMRGPQRALQGSGVSRRRSRRPSRTPYRSRSRLRTDVDRSGPSRPTAC